MAHEEKKYRVDSFEPIITKLTALGAAAGPRITAIHYYGAHSGSDVEKFVEYADHCEIHVLKENNGAFVMTEHRKISGKDEGVAWLKSRGYTTATVVKMDYVEYVYKNGTVGLYTIDDFLHSVILYYPPADHNDREKEFALENAERIGVPYNKYLEQLGVVRNITL